MLCFAVYPGLLASRAVAVDQGMRIARFCVEALCGISRDREARGVGVEEISTDEC